MIVSVCAVSRANDAAAATSDAPCGPTASSDVEALSMAARCDAPVEVLADRDEFQQVAANPDGTHTLSVAAVPQRVQRADGSWVSVDLSLERTGGRWSPAASPVDVSMSGGGSGPLVSWVSDSGTSMSLSWPAALPQPTVSGDHAVYAGVFPGVDLQVTATLSGFEQVLIVHSRQAASNPALAQVQLGVSGGVSAQETSSGSIDLVDASGTVQATSPASGQWDSGIDPQLQTQAGVTPAPASEVPDSTAAEPGPATEVSTLDVSASAHSISVRPDTSMLSAPDTVFPVFVDPPFSRAETRWVYADSSNANYPVGGKMWVGLNPDDGVRFRAFAQFDIAALDGKKIVSAYMQVKLDHSYSCTPTATYLYRLGGSHSITTGLTSGQRMAWSAATLPNSYYLDQGSGNANEDGGCGTVQPDQMMVFDGPGVRADVQTLADADYDAYAVGLCACEPDGTGETTQSRWKRFTSDATILSVTYDTPPNAPTPQPFSTTTDCYKACSSPAWVRTATPTLRTTVSDPDAGTTLANQFFVHTSASTSSTLVTSSGTVNGTTSAAWQLPSGKLANGGTYYWYVKSTDPNGYAATSAWQTLRVDLSLPSFGSTPITSTQYPQKQWGAQCCTTAGTFTFAASDSGSGLESYVWNVDGGSSSTITSSSTSVNASYTPAKDMVHTMYASVKDVAGNSTSNATYQFWVSPLPNNYSLWKLSDATATTAPDTGTTDTHLPGTASSGVSFSNTGAAFSGGGQITTATAALDTTKAFSVAAYVRFASIPGAGSAVQTLVSQGGAATDRFRLSYNPAANGNQGGFCFSMTNADSATAASVSACAPLPVDGNGTAQPLQPGVWTAVAAVFDPTAGTMTIYVMGSPNACSGQSATTTPPTAWSATASLVLGRAGGASSSQWLTGELNSVYAYRRPLSETDACFLAGNLPTP